jgi:NADH-quinone oxidoreductase subunit N
MPDFLPAAPEIFLLVAVCLILIADLYLPEPQRATTYTLTQLALAGCFILTLADLHPDVIYTFNGMYVDDTMGRVLKLMVYVAVAVVLTYGRQYLSVRGLLGGELLALVLFATLGMMVMISAHHFLTLYLGLELLSLCL